MTAQTPEVLIYNGEQFDMTSNPDLNGKGEGGFDLSTGNYRGYVGVWEIVDNKLYLNNLELGHMNEKGPIFADWISEELHAWNGNMLNYVHAGYGSIFEEDVFFKIEKGILTNIRMESNVEKFKEYAFQEIRNAETKYQIRGLYERYLDPKGRLSILIEKSVDDRKQEYINFQKDLEFDFKQKLVALSEDPSSGVTLVYK